jgi:FkbM family methyltransferase
VVMIPTRTMNIENPAAPESHPALGRARLARKLRGLRRLKGWHRVVNWLVPGNAAGPFVIQNEELRFAGDISSFIDRQMYLFGDYEGLEIEQFLKITQHRARRVLLDIGANVGTHSLRFARYFDQVHAFEPNPSVWPSFERNISINNLQNVTLHKVGLGEEDGELPFYAINSKNHGLGTFLPEEQYDQPLIRVGQSRIAHADSYIRATRIGPVDAVKIDVQGFEPMVLRGLRETLESSRPTVWFEYGAGTRDAVPVGDLRGWFPFEVDLYRLASVNFGPVRTVHLATMTADVPLGNYFAVPRDS